MIHFPRLRTRRLNVQLRELTIGQSLALAAMPVHLQEAVRSRFLEFAVESSAGAAGAGEWTVPERTLLVCHYLASTSDGPDFAVGDGKYSDYLNGAMDINPDVAEVRVGEIDGDVWSVRHMTGVMAEAIERTAGEIDGVGGHLHWLVAGMAAQLVRAGEAVADASDSAYDEKLVERCRILLGFPESDFETLVGLYAVGRKKLTHLFETEFDDTGVVVMPKGGAATGLPPARFPVGSCISQLAIDLGGKSEGYCG